MKLVKNDRTEFEIKIVNELLAALDEDDLTAADDAIAKLKPKGKLTSTQNPTETKKD